MKRYVTIFIISALVVTCNGVTNTDNGVITKRSYCFENYQNLMLTISELVTDKFYRERRLEDYETFQIDTTSSTLHVKYRFKYNAGDFHMLVSNVIIFEPNEEETKETYDNYEPTLESGVNSPETRRRWGTAEIDSVLSFGEESHAYEYKKSNRIAGYFLMGRTKNLIVIYSILGDHVTHHDFEKKLKKRIEAINKITAANKAYNHAGRVDE